MDFQELKTELDTARTVLDQLDSEISALSAALKFAMAEANVPVKRQVLVFCIEHPDKEEITYAELKESLAASEQAIAQALRRLVLDGVLARKGYGVYTRTSAFMEALG